MNIIPDSPPRRMRYFTHYQEPKQWRIIDIDKWAGRRDARRSAGVWKDALESIRSDEVARSQNYVNSIAQNLSAANAVLARLASLKRETDEKIIAMASAGTLVPAANAQAQLRSAHAQLVLALFLVTCEISGLAVAGKAAFGSGRVGAITIAILLTTIIAVAIHVVLGHVPVHFKSKVRMVMLGVGSAVGVSGLVGFVLLRSETFLAALSGGEADYSTLSVGNLLLMAGITIGVPLIVGILLDSAGDARIKASSSLKLFRMRDVIAARDSQWKEVMAKLNALNSTLPTMTDKIISARVARYRAAYSRALKNYGMTAEQVSGFPTTIA